MCEPLIGTARRSFLIVALLAAMTITTVGAADVPFLSGRVNDLAEMLDEATESRLDARLKKLEADVGAQVVVLTLPSLGGEALEPYAHEISTTWGLGREGVNDGALLLIAQSDRKMRLEVGYGLEGTIPDAIASRVLNDVIRPRFKEGQFAKGIEEGVAAVDGVIRQDPNALPAPSKRRGTSNVFPLIPFFAVLIFFSMSALTAPAGAAWPLYAFLALFWFMVGAALIAMPLALLAPGLWLILFPILRALARRTGLKEWAERHGGSSWSSASGWSGGGGGWSSGGGFSGGGGSFGGGGASSGW